MSNSIHIFRSNRSYFFGFLFLMFTGSLLLLLNGKTATFISLNAWHPFWLNVFFINYTFIGDGIFAICLIALYLFIFKKRQQGLALFYAFLLSGITVQLIKNLVNFPRPRLFFEPGQYLFFVDDVSLVNNSGFPSGHTATAFAIATVLILMINNKKWQLPLLLAAVLAGYSRIYLAQHFLTDILAGAVIGISSAMASWIFVTGGKNFRK